VTHDRRPSRVAAHTDRELAGLVEHDYVTYATAFAAAPGISVVRTPELVARRGDLADPYLNLVLGTWAEPSRVDGVIDEARAALGGPGRPFTWAVWPSSRPVDLGARLEAAGIAHDGDAPLMTLDLEEADLTPDPPAGLTIERATDAAALAEASPVTLAMIDGPAAQAVFSAAYEALAFGSERALVLFVGRLDGRPVATSALYTGTGLAGVYGVGTLPELRGRGLGRAMTIAALAEGRRRGLRIGALMSSDLGLPVYRRLGFREVGTVAFYTSPADEPVTRAS
jgi:ribosomal protein S18 acetylase RimI-like enzyme